MSEGRARRTALKRTAKPCGPGARCWRQAGGDVANPTGFANIFNPPAMEAKGIRLQGERGISRKPTAQGVYNGKKSSKINTIRPLCPRPCPSPKKLRHRKILPALGGRST